MILKVYFIADNYLHTDRYKSYKPNKFLLHL